MQRSLVWRGVDEPRMEIARADLDDGHLRATGTMIGVSYELRYEPLGERLVRYSSGEFVAEIEFDEDWFVTRYQWLAERVG